MQCFVNKYVHSFYFNVTHSILQFFDMFSNKQCIQKCIPYCFLKPLRHRGGSFECCWKIFYCLKEWPDT